MKILVTAGPTRAAIDAVRFLFHAAYHKGKGIISRHIVVTVQEIEVGTCTRIDAGVAGSRETAVLLVDDTDPGVFRCEFITELTASIG